MIKEKTREASEKVGVDEQYVFKKIKSTLDNKDTTPTVKLDYIKELIGLLDMKPEETRSSSLLGLAAYSTISANELDKAVHKEIGSGGLGYALPKPGDQEVDDEAS